MEKMIQLADKKDCCGCAACYSACPKNAIAMTADVSGFLYPEIDGQLCVKCGLCQKSCPAMNPVNVSEEFEPKAFIAQHKDEQIRSESTSGGAFTAFAQAILEKNGVVFGASMEEGYIVRHTPATNAAELGKFRNSKYVQSEIGDSFRQVKDLLDKGTAVLFSGTPCQIHGLLAFLKKPYDHLITVDIVCHSVPSPAVLKKYIEYKSKSLGEIDRIKFRSKKRGYSFPTVNIEGKLKDKKTFYIAGSEWDEFLLLFLKRYSTRNSCNNCRHQSYERNCDITIWDCNNIYSKYKLFDDNKGTSNVLIRTNKGFHLFKSIETQLNYVEQDCASVENELRRKVYEPAVPADFYKDLNGMESKAFFEKYAKHDLKRIVLHAGRELAYRVGFYKGIRKIVRTFNKG